MEKKIRKPLNVKLFYRRTCLIIYDIISVVGASYLALLMRYSFDFSAIPPHFMEPINRFLPVNIILTLAVLYLIWRRISSDYPVIGWMRILRLSLPGSVPEKSSMRSF